MARAARPASGRGSRSNTTRPNMRRGRIPARAAAQGQAAVYANDGVSAFGPISRTDLNRMRKTYGGGSTSK